MKHLLGASKSRKCFVLQLFALPLSTAKKGKETQEVRLPSLNVHR